MLSNKSRRGGRVPPKISSIAKQTAAEENGARRQSAMVVRTEWQAPLPPPDMLEKYDVILPGLADRIITLAEGEASHRRGMERDALVLQGESNKQYSLSQRRGQIFGLILIVLAFGLAGFALYLDEGAVAGTVASVTITAICGAYLAGRFAKKE